MLRFDGISCCVEFTPNVSSFAWLFLNARPIRQDLSQLLFSNSIRSNKFVLRPWENSGNDQYGSGAPFLNLFHFVLRPRGCIWERFRAVFEFILSKQIRFASPGSMQECLRVRSALLEFIPSKSGASFWNLFRQNKFVFRPRIRLGAFEGQERAF